MRTDKWVKQVLRIQGQNIKLHCIFAYTKSSQLENEIQKTTPFTITSKNTILRNKFSKTQATPLYWKTTKHC